MEKCSRAFFYFFPVAVLSILLGACFNLKSIKSSGSNNTNTGTNSGNSPLSVTAGLPFGIASQLDNDFWHRSDSITWNYTCRDQGKVIRDSHGGDSSSPDTWRLECRLYDGLTDNWHPYQVCDFATHSYSDLLEGSHKFQVRCIRTKANGQEVLGNSNVVEWGVDTLPPIPSPISGNTSYITSLDNNIPEVSSQGADDLSQANQDSQMVSGWKSNRCRILTDQDQTVVDWQNCLRGFSSLSEGSYKLEIQAEDHAGNLSAVQAEPFHLEAPIIIGDGSCQINAAPASPNNHRSTTIPFTCQHNINISDVQCRVNGASWQSCGGCQNTHSCQSSHQLTNLSDGLQLFEVRMFDHNQQPISSDTATWIVDTQAPVSNLAGNPSLSPGAAQIPFNIIERGQAGIDSALVQCQLSGDGIVTPVWIPCCASQTQGSSALTCQYQTHLQLDPGGQYTFKARASDLAGNRSEENQNPQEIFSFSWIDPGADKPICQITSTHNDITNDNPSSYSFTCQSDIDIVEYECFVSTPGGASSWGDCTGNNQHEFNSSDSGTYVVQVRARDNLNQWSDASNPQQIRIDRIQPTVQIANIDPVLNPNVRVNLENIGDLGGSGLKELLCQIPEAGLTQWQDCLDPLQLGSAVIEFNQLLPNRSYTLLVKTVDNAGNESIIQQAGFTTLEPYVAPTCSIHPGVIPDLVQDPTTLFNFSVDQGESNFVNFECQLQINGQNQSNWQSCQNPFLVTNPQQGQVLLKMRCEDNRLPGAYGQESHVQYNVDQTGSTITIAQPIFDPGNNDGDVPFVFDHSQFGSSCAHAAYEYRWELQPTQSYLDYRNAMGLGPLAARAPLPWQRTSDINLRHIDAGGIGMAGYHVRFWIRAIDQNNEVIAESEAQWTNGHWSVWSACSAFSCGQNGQRTRSCSSPSPSVSGQSSSGTITFNGNSCQGASTTACQGACLGCANGATNPPLCNQCAANHRYCGINGQCVPYCSNGAYNAPACDRF